MARILKMMSTAGRLISCLAAGLVLVVSVAGPCGAAGTSPAVTGRVALLPFDNLSEDGGAPPRVMPMLRKALQERGVDVVSRERIDAFLLKERVRTRGYVSTDLARKAGEELAARAVLVGSINVFSAAEVPVLGLSARLIDSSDGRILWADYASASGDDFTTILGMGRIRDIETLLPRVTEMLFSSFDAESLHRETVDACRIAVMPFRNDTGVRDAGMMVTYMFVVDLFKKRDLVPVEYGEVRKAVVDLRVRSRGELDYGSLKALADVLGVDAFLLGTVDSYSDGKSTNSPPRVAVSARLLDARSKSLLWADNLGMSGDDDIVILDWGRIRSVDRLAYRVVSRLSAGLEKACRERIPRSRKQGL